MRFTRQTRLKHRTCHAPAIGIRFVDQRGGGSIPSAGHHLQSEVQANRYRDAVLGALKDGVK